MFERWRKRLSALVGEPNRAAPEAPAPRAGGEGGAGGASAPPAETEPRARDARANGATRLSAKDRAALADAQAASGLTIREFAERHGLKYTTFRNWVQRRQRDRRRSQKSRRFTPEERRAAVEAFVKSGRTRNDFAKLWGCSPSSLDKWLKRYRDEGLR